MKQATIDEATMAGTLRPFARGQIVFALLAAGPELLQVTWNIFRGVDTTGPIAVAIICLAAAAAGALALRLLNRNQPTGASTIFVIATVVCITAALPFQGARSNLVLYIWPTITAALLLGSRFGAAVAIMCAVVGGISYVLDVTGVYQPIIQGWLYDGQNIFDAALALGLVVIAANVAGREIRQALSVAAARGDQFLHLYEAARTALKTVRDGAGPIASSLTSAVVEQGELVHHQNTGVQELAEQTGALALAVMANAELATSQRILNEQATVAVGTSATELEQARALVDAGVAAVRDAQQGIIEIEARSQKVRRVMEQQRETMDEIHILALNAAIEAAGAGEHGRRFEVVAQELNELTNGINKNIDEVSDLVGFEQLAESVTAQVVEVVARFEALLHSVARTIEQMAMARRDIAEADSKSLAMASATRQAATAVQQADSASRQIADAAHQTSKATALVEEEAIKLQHIIDQLDKELANAEEVARRQGSNVTPSNSAVSSLDLGQPIFIS